LYTFGVLFGDGARFPKNAPKQGGGIFLALKAELDNPVGGEDWCSTQLRMGMFEIGQVK
jgi:hypothetical protein